MSRNISRDDHLNDVISILGRFRKLSRIIYKTCIQNPYETGKSCNNYYHTMWTEQCTINFPLLYLASLYLYIYAKQKGCTTFLFATRDCCHWVKMFKQLFPNTQCHYFDCSRIMFQKAIKRGSLHYKEYVTSLTKNDIDKVIFVDVHGTGYNVFKYFQKEFKKIPYCFLLSAGASNYKGLPKISRKYYKEDKLFVLIYDASGSPIEMLNYDIIGTLQDYNSHGAIRGKLEYSSKYVGVYHDSMELLISQVTAVKEKHHYKQSEILNVMNKIYPSIRNDVPTIGRFVKHQSTHKPQYVSKRKSNLPHKH